MLAGEQRHAREVSMVEGVTVRGTPNKKSDATLLTDVSASFVVSALLPTRSSVSDMLEVMLTEASEPRSAPTF